MTPPITSDDLGPHDLSGSRPNHGLLSPSLDVPLPRRLFRTTAVHAFSSVYQAQNSVVKSGCVSVSLILCCDGCALPTCDVLAILLTLPLSPSPLPLSYSCLPIPSLLRHMAIFTTLFQLSVSVSVPLWVACSTCFGPAFSSLHLPTSASQPVIPENLANECHQPRHP